MTRARAPIGTRRILNGYEYVSLGPDHPLGARDGWVGVHRVYCWLSVGPDDQPCHWCGWVLPWRVPTDAAGVASRQCINVDHLDADPLNNDPANLVPSCWWCNANRSWEPDAPDAYREMIAEYAHIHPSDRPSGPRWLARRLSAARLSSRLYREHNT